MTCPRAVQACAAVAVVLLAGCLEAQPGPAAPALGPQEAYERIEAPEGVFAGAFALHVPPGDRALLPEDKPGRHAFRETLRDALRDAMLPFPLQQGLLDQLEKGASPLPEAPAWRFVYQGPGQGFSAGMFCHNVVVVAERVGSGGSSCTSRARDACTGDGRLEGDGAAVAAAVQHLMADHVVVLWYHPGAAYVEVDCRSGVPSWAWHAYAFRLEDLMAGQADVTVAMEHGGEVILHKGTGAGALGHVQLAVEKEIAFGGVLAEPGSYPVWRTEVFDVPWDVGGIKVRLWGGAGLGIAMREVLVGPDGTRHEASRDMWIAPAAAGTWWLEVQDHEQREPFRYTIDATAY